ncbi:MAG: hypothetical protein WC788_03520 [Candidatus Paceibacterota bacterium]|jgi:hypothetical protein
MEFKDSMEFADPSSGGEMEFLSEKEIVIDNGSDQIRIDFDDIRHNIEHLMGEDNVSRVINKIRDFADRVQVEKAKGVHLGSSDLDSAVSSEIFVMKPQELGLKTDKEVHLVAELIKKSCIKEDRDELEIGI